MGTERMTCCGALTRVYSDAGRRQHNPGCLQGPAAVVLLNTREFTGSRYDGGMLTTTRARRTIEIAKKVADSHLERNRFYVNAEEWKPYGTTVGGSRTVTRIVYYRDLDGVVHPGWQTISEVSAATLDSEED